MSDNTVLGLNGDTIRDEDVGGGVKIPVSKIYTGAHGVDGGPVTASNPLAVSVGSATVAVAGTVAVSSAPAITIADGPQVDAFGNLRIAEGLCIFESQQQYGDDAMTWENVFVGTGAVSNLLNESTVQLTTGGTANAASAIRSTRGYPRYQPGKSQKIEQSFCFDGGGMADNDRIVMWGDASDGFGVWMHGTTARLFRRSSVTGSLVTTYFDQANWNLDTFGAGALNPSGLTIDWTKVQLLIIDLQALYVGRVRMGFNINGKLYYAHEWDHANGSSTAYIKSANLPLRYENTNFGITAGTATLRHICSSVISEGGQDNLRAKQFTANNGIAGKSITARLPICTIQAKTTGPNSVRNTAPIVNILCDMYVETNAILYELVWNGTLTAASFSAVNSTYSIAEFDTSATAISGGVVIDSGWVGANSNQSAHGAETTDIMQQLKLWYTALSNTQDRITLVATPLTGTAIVHGAMKWQELTR